MSNQGKYYHQPLFQNASTKDLVMELFMRKTNPIIFTWLYNQLNALCDQKELCDSQVYIVNDLNIQKTFDKIIKGNLENDGKVDGLMEIMIREMNNNPDIKNLKNNETNG